MKNIFLDKKTTIAVIGFGRFGKLLITLLLKYCKAKIIIIPKNKITISHKNLFVKSIEDIKEADIVIPCVPISEFESVIKQISTLIKKEVIIIDVCSVKILPVKIMKAFLPASTQIIASHPMFGPDSYRIKNKLTGFTWVLSNINAKKEKYAQVKNFFNSLKLSIIEISPKDHDKLMAFTLGYSYLIGKIGQRLGIKKTPIDTYDFQLLLEHVSIIRSDSEQLFLDMQTKNPFAKKMQLQFENTFNTLLNEINKKTKGGVKL